MTLRGGASTGSAPPQDERGRTGRDAKGWFLPGHAALKKKGARTIGAADFRDALQADWEAHGAGCIDRMRREQPERFLQIMIGILPGHWERKGR